MSETYTAFIFYLVDVCITLPMSVEDQFSIIAMLNLTVLLCLKPIQLLSSIWLMSVQLCLSL